jgi:hypothetical protein
MRYFIIQTVNTVASCITQGCAAKAYQFDTRQGANDFIESAELDPPDWKIVIIEVK